MTVGAGTFPVAQTNSVAVRKVPVLSETESIRRFTDVSLQLKRLSAKDKFQDKSLNVTARKMRPIIIIK